MSRDRRRDDGDKNGDNDRSNYLARYDGLVEENSGVGGSDDER